MSKKWKDPEGRQLIGRVLWGIVNRLKSEPNITTAFTAGAVARRPTAMEGTVHIKFRFEFATFVLDDAGTTLRLVKYKCDKEKLSTALERAGLVPAE